MKPALTNNILHNPFDNRFNDPVTQRLDDMQAYAYMAWLRERTQSSSHTRSSSTAASASAIATGDAAIVSSASKPSHEGRIFAGVLALFLVLIVSVAVLLKAL